MPRAMSGRFHIRPQPSQPAQKTGDTIQQSQQDRSIKITQAMPLWVTRFPRPWAGDYRATLNQQASLTTRR